MKRIILFLLIVPALSFGQKADSALLKGANTIRNETNPKANTQIRVGSQLVDMVNGKLSRIEKDTVSGTNTYTISLSWVTSYKKGLTLIVTFLHGNTGASTININGYGTKNLVINGATSLSGGEINNGQTCLLHYDGTNFQVVSGTSGGGTIAHANNGLSLSGDTVQYNGTIIKPTLIDGINLDNEIDPARYQSRAMYSNFDSKQAGDYQDTLGTYFIQGLNDDKFSKIISGRKSVSDTTFGLFLQTGTTSTGFLDRITINRAGSIKITPNGTAGTNGKVLTSNASGYASWQTPSAGITALTGDVTASGSGSVAATVVKINGTSLAGLATGILKNTTGTGVPSIAVAGDFPTLNQNTTGSAATLTTPRTIGTITGDATSSGSSFDGSANNTNALTLTTVNSNVGTFGSATKSTTQTVNAKGLITAISEQTITPAVGSITGLGSGVGTWLATPSSSNLASALTDETGTGASVFAGSPTFTGTPVLSTPTATSENITGTGGNGFLNLASQSSDPSQPSSSVTLFSNSGNHFSWKTPADNFSRTLTAGTLTANRTYTLRDYSGSFLIDNGTNTLSGATTITANNTSYLNFGGTATATANNENFITINPTVTSRSTASDAVNTLSVGGSLLAGATGIVASPLQVSTALKSNGGISTGVSTGLQAGTSAGAYISKSVSGMTATTYTNVAPASTSGPGTGALFTVIAASATNFTSFNCTTTGSGYSVGETVTFNGSQFGGSGSITLAIISTTNSIGANAASLTLVNPLADYSGITVPHINLLTADKSATLGSISSVYTGTAGTNIPILTFKDASGTFLTSNGTNVVIKTFNFGAISTTISGSVSAGTITLSGELQLTPLSPAQITSNQNDYAIGTSSSVRLSTDASRNITGFANGAAGRFLVVRNVGSNDIVFTNEDTNSAAANRFTMSTGANVTVSSNHSITFVYDATSSRWFDIAMR